MFFPFFFFFYCDGDHRDLHSFPTRRSSDLGAGSGGGSRHGWTGGIEQRLRHVRVHGLRRQARQGRGLERSEEHTSELQSLRHLVCRLLLEKKKKKRKMRRT